MKKIKEAEYNINFFTQYGQFYLSSDGTNSLDILNGTSMTDEEFEKRLRVFENLLVVIIESDGQLKGQLSLLQNKPALRLDGFDHVVKGSIKVKNEKLEILDCPLSNQELILKMPNGYYRVRVSGRNFDSDEGEFGNNFYKIEILPEEYKNLEVFKQYKR